MFGTKVLSSRYLSFPSHEPPILLFLRFKSHFASLLVGQEINIIFQGSNVLTPEGVATVWNISQVRFEDWTKCMIHIIFILKKLINNLIWISNIYWSNYIYQWRKKSQRLKLVKTSEGDDWESQCKHITIYQVFLTLDHSRHQFHRVNHPPIYWHRFQS